MSLYSLPCLQEVDGITVLWGVRGAAGLFPCEGMTSLFANEKVIAFGVNLELVAKLSENSNFGVLGMRIDDLGGEHSAALQQS